MRLAGIDGCRGGWVVVHAPDGMPHEAEAGVITDLRRDLHTLAIMHAVIDIPIGLTGDGAVREADGAARASLPGRASCVFTAPARSAMDAADHAEASHLNRLTTGRGLSRQSFAILPKIAEVDAVMQADDAPTLFEGHPEVSFAHVAGAPLLTRKRTPAGKAERVAILRELGFADPEGLVRQARDNAPHGLRPETHDVLDAAILLYTASRIASGAHHTLPAVPGRDARGLTMAIHV